MVNGAISFDVADKKKKPTRQRLKEDEKKEETATPEKPVVSKTAKDRDSNEMFFCSVKQLFFIQMTG